MAMQKTDLGSSAQDPNQSISLASTNLTLATTVSSQVQVILLTIQITQRQSGYSGALEDGFKPVASQESVPVQGVNWTSLPCSEARASTKASGFVDVMTDCLGFSRTASRLCSLQINQLSTRASSVHSLVMKKISFNRNLQESVSRIC